MYINYFGDWVYFKNVLIRFKGNKTQIKVNGNNLKFIQYFKICAWKYLKFFFFFLEETFSNTFIISGGVHVGRDQMEMQL